MASKTKTKPRNFGPIHLKPVEIPPVMMFKLNDDDPDVVMIPARTVGQPADENEVPWKDISADEAGPDRWFISVDSVSGWIYGCEEDPTMLGGAGFANCEFWVIEHPGPDTAIRAHKWTGTAVEDFPPETP